MFPWPGARQDTRAKERYWMKPQSGRAGSGATEAPAATVRTAAGAAAFAMTIGGQRRGRSRHRSSSNALLGVNGLAGSPKQ